MRRIRITGFAKRFLKYDCGKEDRMLDTGNVSFVTEKKELLSEKIHDEILELIIKNASEEEMVLNEKRLMELFGVSKAPVREALIKLCSEGVLRNVPRFGYVVVRLQEKDIQDVVKLRVMLEKEALREGFERIVQYHLPEIREQIERASSRGETTDVWQNWEDNEAFHLLLASFGENQLLIRFLKEGLGIQKRSYGQLMWKRRQSLEVNVDKWPHGQIYEALCARDLEKAMELLEQDIRSAMN